MIWQCPGLCRKKILIRNYQIIFKRIILVIVLAACLGFDARAQEMLYSFDMKSAQGRWVHAQLDGRDVISTDKEKNKSTVYINIPQSGYYQFMVSIYHRWREFCPFLYFKIIDSKGNSFSDYTFSEARFYLKPGEGRWEYRSPSASPFWHLNEGRAKIKFWVDAKNDCWEGKDVPMEGEIFIEKFVLIPVDMKRMMQPSIKDENNIKD